MTPYSSEMEKMMIEHFVRLPESGRRHYAFVEAQKLGWGGQTFISKLFDIDPKTIRKGGIELSNTELLKAIPLGHIRRKGGGRKCLVLAPDVDALLEKLIEEHKAGSPTDPNVFWTHLKAKHFVKLFFEKHGIVVSHRMVKKKLNALGYRFRVMCKSIATGEHPQRDLIFEVIFLLAGIMSAKSPVLSIDCKKKEVLGNLHRRGRCYSLNGRLNVLDHDYSHLAKGKVIPHGIYDMLFNIGYMTVGSSHETAEFIGDNLLWWWDNFGKKQYPDAKNILIYCDAGGANSYRHYAFKYQMLKLAKTIAINILICHYPPYASKWNPIEHRLFSQVHKALEGCLFTDYDVVKEAIEKTSTVTGLNVFARVLVKDYEIGLKTKKDEIDYSRIQFHPQIPNFAYLISA